MKSKIEFNPKSEMRNPNSETLRILVLDDVCTDAELMIRELRKAGLVFESEYVDTKDRFLKALEDFSPDLVLSDFSMPRFTGLEALELVKEKLGGFLFNIYLLNPFASLITLHRRSFLGEVIKLPTDEPGFYLSLLMPVLVLALGMIVFMRLEPYFADEL